MKRGYLLAILASAVALGSTPAANAGVVTFDAACGSSGCSISADYRAAPGEQNNVIVREAPGSGFVLDDSGAVITTPRPLQVCSINGSHTIACPYAVDDLTIEGDDQDDVIDVRQFGGQSKLDGGTGDDRLRASPRVPSVLYSYLLSELRGGPGRNVLVGNGAVMVSYEGIGGRVTVDLKKGKGTAPGERDRIVGVGSVKGGDGLNRLYGSPNAADNFIIGGRGKNHLVARSYGTTIDIPVKHKPSTVVCRSTTFKGVGSRDLVLGPCDVESIDLLGYFYSLRSPVVSIPAQYDGQVVVLTSPTGSIIAKPTSPGDGFDVEARLTSAGRKLLRRKRRLRVQVEATFPSPNPPGSRKVTFATVLELPRD